MPEKRILFAISITISVITGCGNSTPFRDADSTDNLPADASIASNQPDSIPTPSPATDSDCATRHDGIDYQFQTAYTPDSDTPTYSLNCAEVIDTSLSDWSGADNLWSGQLIEVTGVVGNTSYTLDGLECMHLRVPAASDIALECVVDRGTWLKCREGQNATVRGYWDSFATSPRLLQVEIVDVVGASTAIEMDVETFLGIIASDFQEARERFRNTSIMLRGTITAIEPRVLAMDGVTPENTPYGFIRIGEANGLGAYLFASHRPGRNVKAERSLRVGDSITASFPIEDLAELKEGIDRIEARNCLVALHEESPFHNSDLAKSNGDLPTHETVHKMPSSEFAALCEKHVKNRETLISNDEYEITGRLLRFDPFVSLNARLGEETGDKFGVKCYLATGGNWSVALPGQTVTLRGRLFPEGTYTGSLLGCRIVSVSGCPSIHSVKDLKTFVMGNGKVDGDLHMHGVAVRGMLYGTSTGDWELRGEPSDENQGIKVEFGGEYQPTRVGENKVAILCGKVMRASDNEFYLNDCILVSPRR